MTGSPLRVAAIQLRAELGDVAANLAKSERLVCDSFRAGAEWVILPEFFSSGIAFNPRMLDAARPMDGEPLKLLVRLARENEGVVGGSFIALRGGHGYNTFALAFPDGSTFFHDKDQPTMWENCYYIGGADDGVMYTPAGPIGAALCWEFIRTRTAKRLLGRIDLVVGGSCWWDLPDEIPPAKENLRHRNIALLRETPSRFARLLGVPVVHASHAGRFEGLVLTKHSNEERPYRSRYLGETQIVDGGGNILARMSYEDGEGFVIADVIPGRTISARYPIPDGFWIPDLWASALKAWERENRLGQEYYRRTAQPAYLAAARHLFCCS